MTLRPLQHCRDCGYDWHSRGKDYALRCPSCRGTDLYARWPREPYVPAAENNDMWVLMAGLIGICILTALS